MWGQVHRFVSCRYASNKYRNSVRFWNYLPVAILWIQQKKMLAWQIYCTAAAVLQWAGHRPLVAAMGTACPCQSWTPPHTLFREWEDCRVCVFCVSSTLFWLIPLISLLLLQQQLSPQIVSLFPLQTSRFCSLMCVAFCVWNRHVHRAGQKHHLNQELLLLFVCERCWKSDKTVKHVYGRQQDLRQPQRGVLQVSPTYMKQSNDVTVKLCPGEWSCQSDERNTDHLLPEKLEYMYDRHWEITFTPRTSPSLSSALTNLQLMFIGYRE